jgi:para-aminobenzoate synthetase component I
VTLVPESSLPVGPAAWFDGQLADQLADASDDPTVLDDGGWWAVVITFEGQMRFWRFDRILPAPMPRGLSRWRGPAAGSWRSSLDRDQYLAGVREIRRRIREGDVYQVNLCRILRAEATATDPWALATRLATGNPAPYAGVIDVPAFGSLPQTRLVSASPELFLSRNGETVASAPIKGTAVSAGELQVKDEAENVMIVDLVRNDLQRVSRPGSVEVPSLLRVEQHPGLVHLVSTVTGRLAPDVGWSELLAATMPPGSVSGAPKISALNVIYELEPEPRGPYCGAVGWVDADRGTARLAVGIRTFWWQEGDLRFGTGAGITWGSDPAAEWSETDLKASRLIALASRATDGRAGQRPGGVHRAVKRARVTSRVDVDGARDVARSEERV